MAKNNEVCLFYVLHSDETWVFLFYFFLLSFALKLHIKKKKKKMKQNKAKWPGEPLQLSQL